MHTMTELLSVFEATKHFPIQRPRIQGFTVSKNKMIPKLLGFLQHTNSGKAIDSKLPLRPPRALNCGMALKRQEMDHSKRKTKVPMMPIWDENEGDFGSRRFNWMRTGSLSDSRS